jgi:thiamine biosynthesis lipoprotein
MHSARFQAMGTEVHVLVPSSDSAKVASVRSLFAEWERRLSRFLPESDLSRLNASAGSPTVVGELLFDVVAEAVAAAAATDGAFDPTLLRQQARIGYDRSFDRMTREVDPVFGPATPGGAWRSIGLDARSRIVALPEGCALDLGGIAKGMAVDAALEALTTHGVQTALVSAGGDLAVRGLPDEGAWHVLVGEHGDQVVPLLEGALATSGVARRSWLQGARTRHHIIDPSTGEPSESGLREVTVAASTCGAAEVAATAAFVLGVDRGAEFLSLHRLAGRFTSAAGTQVYVGPWPAPHLEAA